MATRAIKNQTTNSDNLLDELVLLAETEFNRDLRSDKRIPFFRAVHVQLDGHCFTAFTREVGFSGIGLLHSMELPLEEISIKINIAQHSEQLRLRVEWCESIGEGWYISGGIFLASKA